MAKLYLIDKLGELVNQRIANLKMSMEILLASLETVLAYRNLEGFKEICEKVTKEIVSTFSALPNAAQFRFYKEQRQDNPELVAALINIMSAKKLRADALPDVLTYDLNHFYRFYQEQKDGQPDQVKGMIDLMCSLTNASQPAESFSDKLNQPRVLGDTWFLLDHSWFLQCKKFLGFDNNPLAPKSSKKRRRVSNPGPMDFSQLLDPTDSNELRGDMIEEIDYSLVNSDLFDQLKDEFVVKDGQTPISRLVRNIGMFFKHFKHAKVEVYYTTILLTQETNQSIVVQRQFSKADKLEVIAKAMRQIFDITDDKEVRFWDNNPMSNAWEIITNLSITEVQELYVNKIMIEVKNEDGTWPR